MKFSLLYESKKKKKKSSGLGQTGSPKTEVWQRDKHQDSPGTSSGPAKEGGPKKMAPAYEWPDTDGLGDTTTGWKKHQLS